MDADRLVLLVAVAVGSAALALCICTVDFYIPPPFLLPARLQSENTWSGNLSMSSLKLVPLTTRLSTVNSFFQHNISTATSNQCCSILVVSFSNLESKFETLLFRYISIDGVIVMLGQIDLQINILCRLSTEKISEIS